MKEGELLKWSNSPISYVLSHTHSDDHDYVSEHVAREKGVAPKSYIYVLGDLQQQQETCLFWNARPR